jgi:hypothetical protein
MVRKEIIHKAGSIVDGMVSNYVPSEICDSYYQGFIEGATLADKTMIDKACQWLTKYFVLDHEGMSPSGFGVFEYMFRKAMEE